MMSCWAVAVRLTFASAAVLLTASLWAQDDVLTVGDAACVRGTPGSTVNIPVYVRDVSGTPLGVDKASGNRLQGISFRVTPTPANAIATDGSGNLIVSVTKAGITASLSPTSEGGPRTSTSFSYNVSYAEGAQTIPFTLNAGAPGDQIANIAITLQSNVAPGTNISLTVDTSASVTQFSNSAGSIVETVGKSLATANGCISVIAVPVSLSCPSPSVAAGASGTATVVIGASQGSPTTVSLSSSTPSVATVPSTVTVPAGQFSATFAVTGVSSGSSTITATMPAALGSATSNCTAAIVNPTLTISPPSVTITEGTTSAPNVVISAAQPGSTTIALSSSNSSVAFVPASVVIGSGSTFAPFTITGQGAGTANITATLPSQLGSSSASCAVTVQPAPIVITFTATPPTITEGETSRLSWNVPGGTSVSIDNGVGAVAASGIKDVTPLTTTTYTLSATVNGTPASRAAFVTVQLPPLPLQATIRAVPDSVLPGQPVTLVWSTSGAASASINSAGVNLNGSMTVNPTLPTTYTLTALKGSQSSTSSTTVRVQLIPLPQATFVATPATSNPDQTVSLSWTTSGASSVVLDNGIGVVAASGTSNVNPHTTTLYTLTATNTGGSVTKTAQVVITGQNPSRVITTSGTARVTGTADGTSPLFNTPAAIGLDAGGNLYVIDSGNHTIRKVGTNGLTVTWAGQASVKGFKDGFRNEALFDFTGFSGGLLVYPDGSIDVRDASNHRRFIDKTGNVTTCKGASCLQFQVIAMVNDAAGNLYEAESGTHTILITPPNGTPAVLAGQKNTAGLQNGPASQALFNKPRGLAIDSSSGALYVGDTGNNAIRKIDKGVVTTYATGFSFGCCGGALVIDRLGYIYVTDPGSNTIKRVDPAGHVQTMVGSGSSGTSDGEGILASFSAPTGVALDANGNVIISDSGNDTIRQAKPPTVLSRSRAVKH